MSAFEAVFHPGKQVELEVEASALVLLGEALFRKLRLASGYLVLFLEEAPLFVELASGEHGRPDGAYTGGDAAYRYNQG